MLEARSESVETRSKTQDIRIKTFDVGSGISDFGVFHHKGIKDV